MSIALQELDNFTHFAHQKLAAGDANLTLEDCVRLWRQQREQQATVEDIRQGRIDYEEGLAQPLAEVFEDVRRQLGVGAGR